MWQELREKESQDKNAAGPGKNSKSSALTGTAAETAAD
jgi:hypothetical protein